MGLPVDLCFWGFVFYDGFVDNGFVANGFVNNGCFGNSLIDNDCLEGIQVLSLICVCKYA